MTLYKVSGTVTAEDSTHYAPLFFGTIHQCHDVLAAIEAGAEDRNEAYTVTITRESDPDAGIVVWVSNRDIVNPDLRAVHIEGRNLEQLATDMREAS